MDLFLPITKVDETERLVYARAAQEVPDRTRPVPEVMDYATSKPHFEKWSAEQHEASLGKSFGNVRVMHQKIAAGHIAEPLTFDDDEKAIDVVIKVTDDNDPSVVDKRLANLAPLKTTAGLGWHTDRQSHGLSCCYNGGRFEDAQNTTKLGAYTLFNWTSRYAIRQHNGQRQ